MKLLLAILAALIAVVNCLPRDQFFPFGEDTVDKKLNRRSKKPLSVSFREPFTFLGEEQSVLYIVRDGYVSFAPGARGSKIAPFHAKLKLTRGKSSVWYRTTVSSNEEDEIVSLIQRNFRSRGSFDITTFSPTSFVIVTWENMAVRNTDHEVIGTVTFQLILVADAMHSFAFFLYDDNNDYPRPDRIGSLIDVGFTSGKGHNQWEFEMVYTTEANKAATLFEAMRDSNVGENGMWAYKIDGRMDGNISPAVAYEPLEDVPQNDQPPQDTVDVQLDNAFDVEVLAFEDQCTRQSCSVNGRCVPYPTGHCCACNEGFMGNGIHCLSIANNGRMNGRVNGTINGVTIPEEVYLHTFIMGGGGRTFTAISPVPSSIAYTMQVLLPIGELMGWMFAAPADKGINGFMQTGGVLLYSATITYDSGEEVGITQRFTGVDEEGGGVIGGYVTIEGDVPYLPQGASVNVESHSEVYTKYRPGYVYSSEQRTLDAGGRSIGFTVEQTITYEECEADDINTDASLTAMRMNTTYAYSIFEPEGEILRYAMITSVGPDIGVPTDACQNNNCGADAECLPQGNTFACQCRAGFTGDGYRCEELPSDPCDRNDCDRNAYCYPDGDGYTCQCGPGFNGDGRVCYRDQPSDPCDTNDCSLYAYCYPTSDGQGFYCQCAPEFAGDGHNCEREETANPCDNNNCSPYAYCHARGDSAFYCECGPGYTGDGYICEQESAGNPCDNNNCSPYAYCRPRGDSAFYCECAQGYTGDGYTCEEERQDACLNNRCHPNADCSIVPGGYTCSCQSGYQGDGYLCEVADQLVNLCSDCSRDADCLPEGRGYRCICQTGFNGDGLTCQDVNECVEGSEIACDSNADCYNTRGSYTCRCRPRYRGNGFTCEALPEAEGSLVFGQGMSVLQLPMDGSRGSKVYMKSRQTAVGLAYDCRDEYVYWTDVSGRAIMKASLDGRDYSVIVNTSLSSPEGVAIDHLSRNIYWTDSGFDRIEVANLDGSNRHVLFDTDLVNPRAIVVDPVGGFLYWVDWDRSNPRIEVAGMDGSDRAVYLDEDLIMPNGLSIDLVSQLLCWADAGTQKLECMNLDGDPRSRYTVFNNAQYPFGLTSMGNDLYWTDWQTSNIQYINKNGGQQAQSLALPRGGNGKTYGIAAVTACPDGNNRCASQNGGCRNLCLPAPGVRATCTCPNALGPNDIPCN